MDAQQQQGGAAAEGRQMDAQQQQGGAAAAGRQMDAQQQQGGAAAAACPSTLSLAAPGPLLHACTLHTAATAAAN